MITSKDISYGFKIIFLEEVEEVLREVVVKEKAKPLSLYLGEHKYYNFYLEEDNLLNKIHKKDKSSYTEILRLSKTVNRHAPKSVKLNKIRKNSFILLRR